MAKIQTIGDSRDSGRPHLIDERGHKTLASKTPTASMIVGGNWPCGIVLFRNNVGGARKAPSNLFEIFISTRAAQLLEVTGDYNLSSFHYRTGMVAFNPPGVSWEYRWEGIVEGVVFFVEKDTMRRAASDFFGEEYDDLNWRTALGDSSPAMAHLGLDIASQVADGQRAGDAHLELLMSAFLALAIRRYSDTPARKTAHLGNLSPQVMRALTFMDQELARIQSLREICEYSAASTAQLNRLFRQELGHSVWDFLLQKRLRRASTMLQESDLTIGAIIQKCGFGTRKNFDRQFRKSFDCTPVQFRSRNCEPAAV